MVSAEDLEDNDDIFWGEGDDGSVEYTGNEGATRETTYNTYVLIAYSEESGFECMCAAEVSSAVAHFVREESTDLLLRILSYVRNKKMSISNADCVQLPQVAGVVGISNKEALIAFKTVVGPWSGNGKEMPSTEPTDALISAIARFGWTCAADPIKALTAKLLARKDLKTTDFLKAIDLY